MNSQANILLIDDEPDIVKLLSLSISRMGHQCTSATNVSEALTLLSTQTFDMCITDKNLPDGDGIEIIRYIEEQQLNTPIAMITAYGSLDTGIDAMKAGAFDFLPKPVSLDTLKKLIISALQVKNTHFTSAQSNAFNMVGNSPAMQILKQQVGKVAKNQAPVYIQGESGSGKELVARLIHLQSNRAEAPFIAINCGAIPSELMESEFFGHKKGSFTGASTDKQGLFLAAEGGTLFLDEVADLPLSMQVKLLRTLQEKKLRPIGATQEVDFDVRILSASHKNLHTEIELNRFREDLFYRINVIELNVPALRTRPSDIPELTEFLLHKICKKYELATITITPDALQALSLYDFPGNVRELENMLERAVTLCHGTIIDTNDVQFGRRLPHTAPQAQTTQALTTVDQSDNKISGLYNINDAMGDYDGFMASIERATIEMALEKTRWNKTQAADLLGLSFRTLRYKITKLKIQ